jgi:hypothetical protein
MVNVRPDSSFLIVSLRYLGDVLLSTPIVLSIKESFPQADIDYLVFDGTEGVLKKNPLIRSVITMPPESEVLPKVKTKNGVVFGAFQEPALFFDLMCGWPSRAEPMRSSGEARPTLPLSFELEDRNPPAVCNPGTDVSVCCYRTRNSLLTP